jgi:hypothetical protein
VLEVPGFEADDLIASLAANITAAGGSAVIVSNDKDLLQIVSERVRVWDPFKRAAIGPAEVHDKFGVPPELMVDLQARARPLSPCPLPDAAHRTKLHPPRGLTASRRRRSWATPPTA